MSALWPAVAALVYCVAATTLALHVARGVPSRRTPGLVGGLVAVALHGVALHDQLYGAGGLNLGLFQVASLVGWQVALVVLIASWRLPLATLAVLVLPVVALATMGPVLFESSHVPSDLGWQLDGHILLSLMAYSLLAVAAGQALLVAAQDQHLRQRRPGGWIRALPPLEAMESLLFRLIGLGFILLGLALVTGLAFVDDLFAQHLVHKTVLSVLAWVLFGVLLWGRWRHGWRGRRALHWTLSAFAVLALAYFGSKLVLELVLGRSWG